MVSNLDNADLLCALVKTPGFYLHHVEVADHDPASGSLQPDSVISYQWKKTIFLNRKVDLGLHGVFITSCKGMHGFTFYYRELK